MGLFLARHRRRQIDSCIKRGSNESHFNVLLIFKRDSVRRPQLFKRGEPKRNQTEVLLLTMQTNAVPLGQACSEGKISDSISRCMSAGKLGLMTDS